MPVGWEQVVLLGRAGSNTRVLLGLFPLKYVHSPPSPHILQSQHTFLVDNSGKLSGFFPKCIYSPNTFFFKLPQLAKYKLQPEK